jgi:hypothetical protein
LEDDDLPAADSVDVDAVANEDSFDHFVNSYELRKRMIKVKDLKLAGSCRKDLIMVSF